MTMTLLFLLLCGHTETMTAEQPEQVFLVQVLSYVEGNYANGSLTELAENLHYDLYWLSREIRRKTGKTYTQLVQEKRLAQAAFLLPEHGPERGRHCQRRGLRKSGLLSPHFPGGLRLLPTGIPSANQVTFLDKSRPPFRPAAVVN